MAAEDSAASFQELYRRVYHRFHRRDTTESNRISTESLAVLQHLRDTGPLTVIEAARHFERSQSAMSEIITRLERRSILMRMPDERDRRRTLVWLTEEGLTLLRNAEQVLSPKLLQHAFEQLDEDARQRVLDALDELLRTEKHEPGVKDD